MNAVFNGAAASAVNDSHPSRCSFEYGTSSLQPKKYNDIVEIKSLSWFLGNHQQVVAALCKGSNGETLTVALDDLGPKVLGSQPQSRLTRYRLKGNGESHPGQDVRWTEPAPDLTGQIKHALYFQENAYREYAVKTAHETTFRWVLHHHQDQDPSPFQTWLKSGSHAFWIEGKAGSGKSTLMKYLHQQPSFAAHLRSWGAGKQLIIATFFFWHAGTPLQKSHEGVLRSLLHQVIDQRPALALVMFPQVSRSVLGGKESLPVNSIKLHDLQEAVTLLKKNMPDDLALFLMIDGVDEYSGDHFDFSRFLTQISEHPGIKLLVSSRPIPACVQEFSRFPRLRLQDLTSRDISAYINAELTSYHLLQEMDLEEPGFATLVREALMRKASGVFLWIILVVKKLLIGLGNYDEKESLLAVIDELPSDLEDLYDHMFGKMSTEYQQEASLFFQLISRARTVQRTPFTALQLHAASQEFAGNNPASTSVHLDTAERTRLIKRVEGKLRSRCCGLLEVCYKNQDGEVLEPSVDFLHRTVLDYLRIPNVWQQITELDKLSAKRTDEILLASLVALFLYESKTELSDHRRMENAAGVFADCLLYCHGLSSKPNARYTRLLEKADAAFLDLCKQEDTETAFTRYQVSWELAEEQLGMKRPQTKVVSAKHSIPWLMSLLSLSRMQLPTYLAQKLRKLEVDQASKSTMLLHLLSLCDVPLSTLPMYVQNINVLLQNGADPNSPSLVMQSSPSTDALYLRRASTKPASETMTSVQYWMSVWNCLPHHVEIMSLLVDAGADLSEDKGISRESLFELQDSLRRYRSTRSDVREVERVDNILVSIQCPATIISHKRKAEPEIIDSSRKRSS